MNLILISLFNFPGCFERISNGVIFTCSMVMHGHITRFVFVIMPNIVLNFIRLIVESTFPALRCLTDLHKEAIKFDYRTITDQFKMAKWSDYRHPCDVIKIRFNGPTFPEQSDYKNGQMTNSHNIETKDKQPSKYQYLHCYVIHTLKCRKHFQ